MKQVVDLQNDSNFQSLNVAVLSIAADSIDELSAESQKIGITEIPMLSDTDKKVAASYGVLKWAIPSGEPGHTFVLVNQDGTLAWIQDYGAPDNPNRTMYVPIDELIQAIETHLKP